MMQFDFPTPGLFEQLLDKYLILWIFNGFIVGLLLIMVHGINWYLNKPKKRKVIRNNET